MNQIFIFTTYSIFKLLHSINLGDFIRRHLSIQIQIYHGKLVIFPSSLSTSFSIKDQGIGIPKLELISIFEKFSVSSKTKTPAGGRGVGLVLCKSALEAHDGTISAISDEKGSIFTFTLPKKA